MVGLASDVGKIRSLNEDYANYLERNDFHVYILADGMGGHNAGEVASKMAVESVLRYIDVYFDKRNEDEIISKAIRSANRRIYRYSLTNDNLAGMGTTVVACMMTSKYLWIANVGDSCCLGYRQGEITKITKDHSLVQELVDMGTISEQEAKHHPKKNIITRALGIAEKVDVDVYEINDTYELFLLCSDGLTNEISYEEMERIISTHSDYKEIADSLVELANTKGGRDNVTVLLFGGEMK